MTDLIEVDPGLELERIARNLSKEEIRIVIAEATKRALSDDHSGTPIDIPVNHHFSKDVYAREMVVPKGSFIIGKIHKFQNLNILSKGEVSVLSIDGYKRVKAPFTFVASPGSQRIFYAHEDSVWTVIHGTNETDVDKIEEQFIAKSIEELEGGQKCLGSQLD